MSDNQNDMKAVVEQTGEWENTGIEAEEKTAIPSDISESEGEGVQEKEAPKTEAKATKKIKGGVWKAIGAALVVVVLVCGYVKVIVPANAYKNAMNMLENGEYDAAIEGFKELGDYKDASDMVPYASFERAMAMYRMGDLKNAIEALTLLRNYPDAQEKLPEVMLEYAEELVEEKNYPTALTYLKKCGENEYAKKLADETAAVLLNEKKFDTAIEYYSYVYNDDPEHMKAVYYEQLNWQFDSYDYKNIVETYQKVAGYGDVDTNEKFNGAKLIAAGKLKNDNTEFHGFYSATEMDYTFEFTPDGILNFNIYGADISLITFNFSNRVDIDDSWEYRFEGNKIFLKDEENTGGEFREVGKIIKFNEASGDDKASVTLTLDLPGSMSFKKVNFEYGE